MKKFIYVLALVCNVALCFAQEQNNMFVYRNDGDFNAFFLHEIDSITFSEFDIDSTRHEQVEIQVIWTKDSIYRIPVDVIDSISFRTPETKYQSEVVKMTAEWMDYVVEVNDMQITFSSAITDLWTPTIGAVLYYDEFDDTFPDGFAGRVTNIEQTENYIVMCDSVSFDDIWDEIIIIEEYDVIAQRNKIGEVNYQIRKRLPQKKSDFENNINVSWEWRFVSVEGEMHYGIKVYMYKQNGNFTFELKYDYGLSANIQANAEVTFAEKVIGDKMVELKRIPIGQTPLRLDLGLSPMIELEIKGGIHLGYEFSKSGYCSVKYHNGEWSKGNNQSDSGGEFVFTDGLSGKIGFGIQGEVKVGTIGNFLSFKGTPTFSSGLSCDLSADCAAALKGGNGYEISKDITIDLYAKLDFDVTATFDVYVWKVEKTQHVFTISKNIFSMYLFPEFSDIVCENQGNDNLTLLSYVSRNVIVPTHVGYRIYSNGSIVNTEYLDHFHYMGSTRMAIDYPLTGFSKNGVYVVRPMLKLFNWEVEAAPSTKIEFTESQTNLCLNSTDENVVFFQKPASWSSNIYCYFGDSYGLWPGIQATPIGGGYYKVVFESDAPSEGNLIIWNVGGGQCEASPQTNDLSYRNRCLYVINGTAENPNYSGGMNLSESEDCLVEQRLPVCSTTPITELCSQCKCGE